jgi:hypothetical protein
VRRRRPAAAGPPGPPGADGGALGASDERLVALVIRRHGEILDLRADPGTLIEVLRRFGPAVSGAPTTRTRRARRRLGTAARALRARLRRRGRARPPSPAAAGPLPGVQPTTADVMKQVLALTRSVEELRRRVAPPADGGRARGIGPEPEGRGPTADAN